MSAIGLRVGPFEICDEIDVPGAGAWYLARRTGLTRRKPTEALVRLLGPAPTTRELAAAQRQFDVLRAVDDARFPRAIALYEGSGALAVEAPVGPALDKIIEARLLGDVTMTPATLLDLALDLTDALAHAHGRGIHHGHLSASTLTLAQDGALTVWGLGAADARPAFSWLPPERARGEAATAMTDQWSLGAIIVSLVTGRTPWSPGDVDVDPRSGNVDGFVEPLARQWPALGRLVRRLMDDNPTLRFPSLHPVRLELLGLSRRAGGTSDRRGLAAWLHRQVNDDPALDAPAAPAAARVAAPSMPPSVVAVPVQISMDEDPEEAETPIMEQRASVPRRAEAPAVQVAVEMELEADPRDRPPEIQAARRSAESVPSKRMRDHRPLPAEAMDVVHPDAMPEDVPVTGTAAPRQAAAISLPTLQASSSDELPPEEPTEFAEELLPTEMATELAEDDDPMVTIPPVRTRLSAVRVELTDESLASLPGTGDEGPEPLHPSAPAPNYRAAPVPTLPGMEVPEPAAERPVLAVQVELDDEVESDDLLVEDPLLEDITGEVRDARLPAEDRASRDNIVAVAVQIEDDGEELLIEFDDEPVHAPAIATPSPTVVPFTDPHFTSMELGPVETSSEVDSMMGDDDAREPDLGLEGYAFIASARWPWERDDPRDPEPPEADPVVRAAPWVASATVGVLAVLLVVNILI